jgi:cell division protein FtsA
MAGAQLEADVHVVHGLASRLQNAVRVVRGLQLDVEDVVFNGIASSLAVLSPQDKELGVLAIDLGAGVTDYVAYVDGILKHSGVLAVGGDHVTNDLAYGLKVSLSTAEALKLQHGSALPEEGARGRTVSLDGNSVLPERVFNLDHLRRIMHLRLEETFELIADDLAQAGLPDYLRAGVVLCGGGARIPGIERLAGRVFDMPVALGRAKGVGGLVSTLDQPEFATAIGLAKFASLQERQQGPADSLGARLRTTFAQMLQRP